MLDPVQLRTDLCGLSEYPANCKTCENYPTCEIRDEGDCQAGKWAEAMRQYSANVIPASTTVDAASSALETELMAAFILQVEASTEMELAFANFANAIATGMLPAYVGTPPPGIVGFLNLFTMDFPETWAEGAQRFATAIDNWMKTGTATPSGGGSPINWS